MAIFDTAKITKVDDKEIEGGYKVAVLPGERKLDVYCYMASPHGEATRTIEKNFEAGQKYDIAMGYVGDTCLVIVVKHQ